MIQFIKHAFTVCCTHKNAFLQTFLPGIIDGIESIQIHRAFDDTLSHWVGSKTDQQMFLAICMHCTKNDHSTAQTSNTVTNTENKQIKLLSSKFIYRNAFKAFKLSAGWQSASSLLNVIVLIICGMLFPSQEC